MDRAFLHAFCILGLNPSGSIFKNKFSSIRVRVMFNVLFSVEIATRIRFWVRVRVKISTGIEIT